MNRRVVDVLNKFPERNLFLRGLRARAGFRQVGLEYDRESRAAGETKYPFARLCELAADGVFPSPRFRSVLQRMPVLVQ
jgi:polyisoprenyl-phosphate glycosyltransferase